MMQVACFCQGCQGFVRLLSAVFAVYYLTNSTGDITFPLLLVAALFLTQGASHCVAMLTVNKANSGMVQGVGPSVQVQQMQGVPLTAMQAQPSSAPVTMSVTCPAGVGPGGIVQVQAPDG